MHRKSDSNLSIHFLHKDLDLVMDMLYKICNREVKE